MYKKVKNSIKLCDKSDNLSIKVCFYCAFSSWFSLRYGEVYQSIPAGALKIPYILPFWDG